MRYKQTLELVEDTSSPVRIEPYLNSLSRPLREAADSFNRYLLTERESHGRRTRIRIAFEALARTKRSPAYSRLRQKHVVLNLPSAEQAELAIEIIRQVCASMEGKHLVRAPKP
jgi:hypothetical protein